MSLCNCWSPGVEALDLSSTGLQGYLPGSIFDLPNLQRLILLDNNDLDIKLPKSTWRSGSSLRDLDLSLTNLSGELPESIGYLKSLNSLRLSWTSFSGKLPESIGYLKSLNYLILFQCKLQGSIPKSLGNLTQIRELDLSKNSFNGEVPATLSNLKQLTMLGLSSNNFEGRIPVLAELTRLESLFLRVNNFIGGFPLWVANLKPLGYLEISRNQLTGPIPFNLSGLQNLREFYLYDNYLSGVIPPSLFTLPLLEQLDLHSNCLTGQILEFQHHLPLYTIDLSDNQLHGSIPQSISILTNLTTLSVAFTNLRGVVDSQIFKNLEYLSLSNTNLSVISRSNVNNNTLPNLKFFVMSSCNVEVFPDFLRTAENLQNLDLSENRVHGQIPNWAGFMWKASLIYLNLSHNFLTDIKELPWEQLYTLDLHSNWLQGPLPIPPPSYYTFSSQTIVLVEGFLR
ncbi:hypothetical protein RHMOL_Rhmol01G0099400 [Rhododendron molle]|uniref:Uncharacterized protein n=1 Tax=Rhododendron molle TaxID=49168 RepID=A0ACC0Q1P1_RHOML|nr:hypothetical protein RHMOL_Rhmol01G0099400 [Rhododendron molle]